MRNGIKSLPTGSSPRRSRTYVLLPGFGSGSSLSFPPDCPYNIREVTSRNLKKLGYPWGTPPFPRRTEEAEIWVIIISRDAGEKAAQNGDLTGYGILWYNKSK